MKTTAALESKCWVIIPAAGIGQRMGSETPKQYLKINNETIVERTISLFSTNFLIEKVVVVLHPSDTRWSTLNIQYPDKVVTAVGGDVRVESVRQGLLYLKKEAAANDWVLVHDVVRPCLSSALLNFFINTIADHRVGGLLALPVTDTIKKIDTDHVVRTTISREGLWVAQTPQMFRYGFLLDAIENAIQLDTPVTDESCAIELAGEHPIVIRGDWRNIKITTPEDLEQAKGILQKAL